MIARTLFAAVVVTLAAVAGACDTTFQDECHTATGAFAARYELLAEPSGTCDDALRAELKGQKGDTLGMQWYEVDHYHRDPKRDRNLLAIQTNTLGTTAVTYAGRKTASGAPAKDTAGKLYALGTFTTAAPKDDAFCEVPALEPAQQELPATLPGAPDPKKPSDPPPPALPAVSLKYEWSDVRVYDSPEVSGAEVSAKLAYTKNGCTARYRVLAIYPLVPCIDKKTNQPSEVMCDPAPRPELGHPVGSGLDFPVRCDRDLGFCVLAKDDIP